MIITSSILLFILLLVLLLLLTISLFAGCDLVSPLRGAGSWDVLLVLRHHVQLALRGAECRY